MPPKKQSRSVDRRESSSHRSNTHEKPSASNTALEESPDIQQIDGELLRAGLDHDSDHDEQSPHNTPGFEPRDTSESEQQATLEPRRKKLEQALRIKDLELKLMKEKL
jgi:hypothetical protein